MATTEQQSVGLQSNTALKPTGFRFAPASGLAMRWIAAMGTLYG
jgi:hypothetical protein